MELVTNFLFVVGSLVVIIYFLRLFCLVENINKTLNKILVLLTPDTSAKTIEFYTTINGQKEKVTHMFLKVNQNLPLTVQFTDAKGNPAVVDGIPTWAVTDATLATLDVAADGLSATLIPTGPIGSLVVQVNADADMGEGVKTILGELPVDLIAGDASTVVITAGTPVDQA